MSSAQLKSKANFFQTGQGIIEVIVTIAIGTILILALVVLSVRSNRSSDFSKANSQAYNLATEGLEFIKNLKNINGVSGVDELFKLNEDCTTASTIERDWGGLFGVNVRDDISCPSPGKIGYFVSTPSPCTTSLKCLYFDNSTPELVSLDGRTFTRTVYIADTPPGSGGVSYCNDASGNDWNKIKQFTVEVSFTDSSGTHSSTQSSCITI